MLNLQDLLAKIAASPVGDLAMGGGSSGTIPPASLPGMGLKIDAALLRLFTMFPLLVKTIELKTFAGRYMYPLQVQYALTGSGTEPQRFILDSGSDPFLGDVLAVERVFDGEHALLPLNDRQESTSWFTAASPTTLAMDYPVDDTHYFVDYRARHPKVDMAAGDPSTVSILIPDVAENALVAGIVYECFCTQTGENAMVKSQEMRRLFDAECTLLDDRNSLNQHNSDSNIRFCKGGWV